MVRADRHWRRGTLTPYYEQSGITIYNTDCRHVLPSLSAVSLLLTDPPYGIGEARGKNKSRSNLATARDYGVAEWDDAPAPPWLLAQAMALAAWSIIWGGNFYNLPPASCWLVWDKDNGENDFADCELAWTNLKRAVRRFRWRWAGMLQEEAGARKERRDHPTQKPEPLMIWAIQQAPIRDTALVLDPFMGVGTTLVAAKRLGLSAIGIERREEYCALAVERLQQEALPLSMDSERQQAPESA